MTANPRVPVRKALRQKAVRQQSPNSRATNDIEVYGQNRP